MSFRPYFFAFNLWFSYTISLVASIFFIIFDLPDRFKDVQAGAEAFYYLFFIGLLVAIAGAFLSLFKQKAGAIFMLIGGIAMVCWHILQTPPMVTVAIVYGFPYLVPGFFLLLPKRETQK
jgi:hypothetical protein